MGIIEDSLFSVYRDALNRGDIEQAEHAVDIMKKLREKVDIYGFVDPQMNLVDQTQVLGSFFTPFPYRYYEAERMLVLEKTAIILTEAENKLFKLFTENETQGMDIKPITNEMIRSHIWGEDNITSNAIRLSIKRIRNKIEPDPSKPKVLINLYQKGYLFLGKRIFDEEISQSFKTSNTAL